MALNFCKFWRIKPAHKVNSHDKIKRKSICINFDFFNNASLAYSHREIKLQYRLKSVKQWLQMHSVHGLHNVSRVVCVVGMLHRMRTTNDYLGDHHTQTAIKLSEHAFTTTLVGIDFVIGNLTRKVGT
jgi:hypothetical protein